MRVEIVKTRKQVRDFLNLPVRIYKGNENYIPFPSRDILSALRGETAVFRKDNSTHFIVSDGKKCVCRAGVYIKGGRGYFSLFECFNDNNAFNLLFERIVEWLSDRGISTLTGPESPFGGDNFRGVLLNKFNEPPVIFDNYNPPYYKSLFEDNGFKKEVDFYTYRFRVDDMDIERYERVARRLEKRNGIKVEDVNQGNLTWALGGIKRLFEEEGEGWFWGCMDDFLIKVKNYIELLGIGFIKVVKNKENRVIGFSFAIPNLNQLLRKKRIMGIFSRDRITSGRLYQIYVSKRFRKKGVFPLLVLSNVNTARKFNIDIAYGGNVSEENREIILPITKLRGEKWKVFRLYSKRV